MKKFLATQLETALSKLETNKVISKDQRKSIHIEQTKNESHGDFATNLALTLSQQAKMNPRDLAQKVIDFLPKSSIIEKTVIAGPGFINFFLRPDAYQSVVFDILDQGEQFGTNPPNNKKVLLEFVSANPTGPLHVGHGRGAAYGAALASLLKTRGYQVDCEYYVNDAGRQMDILAVSTWLRYLVLENEKIAFPSKAYQGHYIIDIAKGIRNAHKSKLNLLSDSINEILNTFEEKTDQEKALDELIRQCKETLGEEDYKIVFDAAINSILEDIRCELEDFGVTFDSWFSENSLMTSGAVDKAINTLKDNNHLYSENGATWFKSSKLGDEKDRVIIRENGLKTYFASDIAYHYEKFKRNYDLIIDIWGADHHGYIPRVEAALKANNCSTSDIKFLLVQFANLYRGGKKLQMSTRSGEFVTLRTLRKEVGNDAARFFYAMRKCEQHMDFDLDLAKSRSNENPVFYIQYAHARICSVLKQAEENGKPYNPPKSSQRLSSLSEELEIKLMKQLAKYGDTLDSAALDFEPHQIVYYLKTLAQDLHSYYNAHQFIIENNDTRNARLALITATKQIIKSGLRILGVSAPEKM